jgi:hypothetical protein
MNTLTKKSLHVALAGLGTLGLAGAANAVMVNPNGLGQVLIYPYYTVRSPAGAGVAQYNTLLSIVNTTNSVKAVKVRFKEGKASKEVLDFNVFLSPKDMWTAAVEPDGADGAQISTTDTSCTIPSFGGAAQKFRTTLSAADIIGGGADRVTEGYFEVFEMATYSPSDPVAVGATHSSGVPANCGAVTDTSAAVAPRAPNGGLSGGATLINVLTGDAFTEDATALTQFQPSTGAGAYFTTGSPLPNYDNAVPAVGAAVNGSGQIISGAFATGSLAVTAALQKSFVGNEFVLEKSTLSGTDWVITFPTKGDLVTETAATLPFQNKLGKSGACDDTVVTTWDREEGKITPGGPDFSPSPKPTGFALCWEVNIISFKNDKASGIANVLGSANNYTLSTPFANGWGSLTFRAGAINVASAIASFDPVTGGAAIPAPSTTFSGLPTIGFAAQTFVNGTLANGSGTLVQSSYGGNFGHRYIGPQP